jgi:hypothetical protein
MKQAMVEITTQILLLSHAYQLAPKWAPAEASGPLCCMLKEI